MVDFDLIGLLLLLKLERFVTGCFLGEEYFLHLQGTFQCLIFDYALQEWLQKLVKLRIQVKQSFHFYFQEFDCSVYLT